MFEPIAVDNNCGVFSSSTMNLLFDLSHRISLNPEMSERVRIYSNAFLSRFSVLIRCFCMTLWLLTHRTY